MADAPDWQSMDDYAEIGLAAADRHDLAPQAFLHGPIARLLDLASDPAAGVRVRARIMEFARSEWRDYAAARPDHGADAAAFVQQRLSGAADEDYLLDVWDGLATHNYSAEVPRKDRA